MFQWKKGNERLPLNMDGYGYHLTSPEAMFYNLQYRVFVKTYLKMQARHICIDKKEL